VKSAGAEAGDYTIEEGVKVSLPASKGGEPNQDVRQGLKSVWTSPSNQKKRETGRVQNKGPRTLAAGAIKLRKKSVGSDLKTQREMIPE